MRRVILAPLARRDFAEIATFITSRSGTVRIGRDFVQRLRARCVEMASLPGVLGVARHDLGQDVRATFHGNYVILFCYEAGAMRILRVMEGHRDIKRQLRPEET